MGLKEDTKLKIFNGIKKKINKSRVNVSWVGEDIRVHITQKNNVAFTYTLYDVLNRLLKGETTEMMVDEVLRYYKKIILSIFFKENSVAKNTHALMK